MNKLLPNSNEERRQTFRARTYLMGGGGGLFFGLLTAYLYVRANEEEIIRSGEPTQIKTTELIGVVLSAMGMVRMIAELGKGQQKSSKR